ncbi:MAG: hypothetical protein DI556_18760 [Rhodovulum sulfidophilum]|uniref:Capsule synthesis protein CapA domain-containing protein n=1 Tax=Rhodovulum sulfidophilum TaxID=35806 RepID=A0A2W5N3T7_RHOSU|nr:MAG: hypothetical protein DI556_18760 [Rhodovulum sulfidophilum]
MRDAGQSDQIPAGHLWRPLDLQVDGDQVSGPVLALTGDIIPIRRLAAPPEGFAALCGRLAAAEAAIGNFEIALVEGGAPLEKLMTIKGDPALAADLPLLGLDLVTLANNHVPDYGLDGMRATRALIEGAGLATIGFGETLAEARRPHVIVAGGRRIGVVAFTCLTPTGSTAAADRPGLSAIRVRTGYEIDPWYQMEEPGDPSVIRIRTHPVPEDLDTALAWVAEARRGCDMLVVTIHWGFGSGDDLAEYQEPLGRALIDAGADVVHGHHPHAIHPVAFHRRKPILFGLGTFVGQQVLLPASETARAMWARMSPDGMIAEIGLDDGSLRLVPHRLAEDRLARPATPGAAAEIADRLARLSAPFGTRIRLEADGTTLVAEPPACANRDGCARPCAAA